MLRLSLLGSRELERADQRDASAVFAQPKRFALLAYMACRADRFHRRDTLLAVFWPELDTFAARRALRNALYQLRLALGSASAPPGSRRGARAVASQSRRTRRWKGARKTDVSRFGDCDGRRFSYRASCGTPAARTPSFPPDTRPPWRRAASPSRGCVGRPPGPRGAARFPARFAQAPSPL
jgi:DNA-binding SARP family transcriptional activator